MVEKIIINPEEVRAYGNIIEMKEDTDFILYESTLETSTDTIGGETVPVFELQSDFGELTVLTLTTSSSTVVLNGSVTLTATLKDEDNAAINGATITFKDGSTTLGTSTTNSSGVATYTYTASSVGSHTLEASFGGDATYASSNANTNVTVLDHSYTLAFDSASYTATGGSATLSMTLLDNNVPVEGATISVSGSDSSLYTGITNSSGVAEVIVTNVTGTVTFSCTYSNVSDTCTVTASSYLFYDECTSADGLSQYGSLHTLKVTNVAGTLSYDSNMNAYKITTTTGNADGLSDFPILALDNKDNYYIEAEFYTTDTTTGGQPGLVVYPTTDTGGNGVMWRDIASINRCGVLPFSNYNYGTEKGNSSQSSLVVANNWIRVRLEVNGTSVKGIWLKANGTEVYSYTYTVPYTSGAMRVGLATMLKSTTNPYYVRNIKAEYL